MYVGLPVCIMVFRVIRVNQKKDLTDSGEKEKIIDRANTREGRWRQNQEDKCGIWTSGRKRPLTSEMGGDNINGSLGRGGGRVSRDFKYDVFKMFRIS